MGAASHPADVLVGWVCEAPSPLSTSKASASARGALPLPVVDWGRHRLARFSLHLLSVVEDTD